MQDTGHIGGSATHWGPLFGEGADYWAQTWEGPEGWGTPAYELVLAEGRIGSGTRVLDCGCGAGRFARMAADSGAEVAGLDAAQKLIEIAAQRTPEGDFRVGDLEALPWPDDSFDIVTGFSVFQFASDKTLALAEARRVSRGTVVVVNPIRVSESSIAAAFKPLFPLFSPGDLETLKLRGMFALSEAGKLEQVLASAGLTIQKEHEIDCPIVFPNLESAVQAYLAAGATVLAVRHAGETAVTEALRTGLAEFVDAAGNVALAGTYRVIFAHH